MIRGLVLLIILGLLGFYVAWPAWSGYEIKAALDAEDTAKLAKKIDFARVRESLRPAVTAEVDKRVTAALAVSGQPADVLAKAKAEAMPKLVEATLSTLVTPDSVVRIYRDRADARGAVARIAAEKMASPEGLRVLGSVAGSVAGTLPSGSGQKLDIGSITGQLGKLAEQSGIDPGKVLGGLVGKPAVSAEPKANGSSATASRSTSIGIDNVKSFTMNGMTGYSIGIAKDKAATKADLVADIAFTGADWQLVGLAPNS